MCPSGRLSIRLKRIPLVILNPGLVQKVLVFVSPVRPVMVLRLGADIIDYIVKSLVAYGESTVSLLPSETLIITFVYRLDPLAAVGLDVFHELV